LLLERQLFLFFGSGLVVFLVGIARKIKQQVQEVKLLSMMAVLTESLCTSETKCFTSECIRDTFDFKHHRTGWDRSMVVFYAALSSTHWNFESFFGKWFVWENTAPYFASTLESMSR
jgi:hypothetical protein